MGCQSSLMQSQTKQPKNETEIHGSQILDEESKNFLNLSFNDFIKGNIGEVYNQYTFKGWINKSNNSIVRWVEHKRSQAERVIKIIKRNNNIDIKIMKQINVLKKLDHPNIVKLYQYFIDREYVYMIFQPIYGKRIFNQIVGIEEKVLRNLRHIMKQLLQALQYCHSQGVMHINITPDNLMLVEGYTSLKNQNKEEQIQQIKLNQKVYLKIVGFGQSILCEKTSNQASYQNAQYFKIRKNGAKIIKKRITQTYMSPQTTTTDNATKQDIWSCGILMQTILQAIFKVPNFMELDKNQLQKIMIENSKSIKDSQQSLDLLKSMLEKDPQLRFSAKQCLNHPYFKDIDKVSPWKITQTFRSLHDLPNMYQSKENNKATKKQTINKGILYKYLTMYLTFKQPPHVYHNQFITEFYNLDKNKDGMIQYNELLEGLMNFFKIDEKSARQYVNQIFEKLDKNSNGCIQYSQFVMGTIDVSKILSKKSLKTIFKEIDKNEDGYIDKQQLQVLFGIQASAKIFNENGNLNSFIQGQSNAKISEKQFQQIFSIYYQQDSEKNKPIKPKTTFLPSFTKKVI